MLENLTPADKITSHPSIRVGVEFDGSEGWGQTPGLTSEPESFDEFLQDAGIDPDGIEVIPPVRTSRWQQQKDGELVWLTSYRFNFRKRSTAIDLPLLAKEAESKLRKPPKAKRKDSALVILWSDLQVGKVDINGGVADLYQRVADTHHELLAVIDREKPSKVIFADLGDTVENFDNKASMQQLYSNDLSIMDQVDLATTLAWRTLRAIAEQVPEVTYVSVGSNHCQWRKNGQVVGKATDDWGVFIGRQLARLAQESSANNVRFVEPQPHDESLALDVFGDGYHILGVVHGHQARNSNLVADWWKKQAFGNQPVASATTLIHGHFHHLRIEEHGQTPDGNSRFVVGAPTLDNGSNWWRTVSGDQAPPGLAYFIMEKQKPYTGTVHKI
jgi:hypothetical protein